VARMGGHNRHFPIAPISRSFLMNGRVGVHEETMVSLDKTSVAFRFRSSVSKASSFFGEENAYTASDPFYFLRRCRRDAAKHHLAHTIRISVAHRRALASIPKRPQTPAICRAQDTPAIVRYLRSVRL
jgi:hypothetical protein